MRYAYAITSALLVGGASAALVLQNPAGAQTAQNEPGAIQASSPRAGAPMSFADMVAKLQPAVVNISTTQRVQVQTNPFAGTPFGGLFGGQQGGRPVTRQAESLGSGFIISADGYVVTNNHVISAGQRGAVVESIKVTLSDRREYTAKLIGRDPESDLAVLKIEGANLPFVKFGDSNQSRVGDWVVAIGNPFGLGGSVTAGIISALHRVTGQGGPLDRFIQTDASINRGNSGGPMFDLNGNVIGINSQILSPTGGNVGIGFAIPATEAKPIIDTLMKGDKVERGYLGVGIQPLTDDLAKSFGVPKGKGELISRVEPGEAAAKAGIKQGDIIMKVDGKEVTPDTTLSYLAGALRPGSRVPIELIRDGKRMTVQITVGTRPPVEQLAGFDPDADEGAPSEEDAQQSATASLGLSVAALTPQIARSIGVDPDMKGVVVVGVDPSSDAAQKQLRRGDVIVSINRTPVATPAEVARIVSEAKQNGDGQVLLYVTRRGGVGGYFAVDLTD
ncbi:DegQ family serine endoprotease [Sphingomonas suaedae]|uniref:Probable periplasmic serine endoprotease DegP-like n=1 Tax=Sphingomonas suaedae TaxID=2599297 RepID=A0A518RLQ1_9SPHN|nr:DegQ family serine endoprotease [Sphingomonas suaedae]QDX28376.1 DegQ family serine endoprotease [Sphingomonas suaedae]